MPDYSPTRHRLVLFQSKCVRVLPQRRWLAIDHFAILARQVLERWPDVVILITGSPSEKKEAEELRLQVAHERMGNFAGQVKLRELTVLYSLATVMVTNDSGPGHFASVTNMPAIVLFGPETPALYGSSGRRRIYFRRPRLFALCFGG